MGKNQNNKATKANVECCCMPYCNGCRLESLDINCFTCQEGMHNFCGVMMQFEGNLVRRCPNCFLTVLENDNVGINNNLLDQENVIIIEDNSGNSKNVSASAAQRIDNNPEEKENPKIQTKENKTVAKMKGSTLKEMNKSLVGKQIAICVDGENAIEEFVQYKQFARVINNESYIFGIIISMESKPSSQCLVEWESTEMKVTKFPTVSLVSSILLASQLLNLEGDKNSGGEESSNSSLYKKLYKEYEDEYISSDEETDDENVDNVAIKNHSYLKEDLKFPSLETTYPEVLQSNGLIWKTNGSIDQPFQPSYPSTKLKEEKAHMFQTPLQSFFAFLPLEFWQLYAMNTNFYFKHKLKLKTEKGIVSHDEKWKDVSVPELLQFFGVLIKMVLRPMPGRPYVDRWDEPEWHPYTKHMKRSRFRIIRSNLQMSDVNSNLQLNGEDELYKVRPLLNVLKKTLGDYVQAGSNLTIDESSVSARSAYGRNLIFYNNSKPCGKYHFRFYFVCDADVYACLRFRVHTKSGSDEADGLPTKVETDFKSDEEEEAEKSIMTKLVLDMVQPWFHSKRVINMDNYYTSPQVFLELKAKGLYARGTCRQNRKRFPKSIQFSKGESKNKRRGEVKVAVEEKQGMVAFGWIDGNPVHMLTTADGTSMSKVTRRVKSEKQQIDAPTAIVKYNHGMQAVDRFDQLNAMYSMAQGNLFKKYYHKLTLALIDVALTNAEIHYYLANPNKKKDKNHRYIFRDSLAEELLNYQASSRIVRGAAIGRGNSDLSNNDNSEESCNCNFTLVSKFVKKKPGPGRSYLGLNCQVCKWEGRSARTRSVVLCQHGIRSCSERRDNSKAPRSELLDLLAKAESAPETYPSFERWYCLEAGLTCYEKLHKFYLPKKLFGPKPKLTFKDDGTPICHAVHRTSNIYWEKIGWRQEMLLANADKEK